MAPDRREILPIAEAGLNNINDAFAKARPAFEQYKHLRQVYAQQRLQPLPKWPTIGDGPVLRPGMQDSRVPALVQRLMSEGYLDHKGQDATAEQS